MLKSQHTAPEAIRLGFVPLVDCAPIVMAEVLGLYEKHGLEVQLQREIGWATIRDKIIYGELHAAHAPAGVMVSASCGLGCVQTECITGLVLNLHGNAITISQALWRQGVRDGASLQRAVHSANRKFTFGVVHNYSSHSFLLREWLRRNGIEPDRDVNIVVVPPPQMPSNLKAGHLDGFCAGEPWNSAAVLARTGWVAATSVDLAPMHPEKVLMVKQAFEDSFPGKHRALIAALLEACTFCDRPENRERIIEVLGEPGYVGQPTQVIRASLGGTFDFGNGHGEKTSNFHIFHRNDANVPTIDHALWVIRSLHSSGLVPDPDSVPLTRAAEWFRTDIYHEATEQITQHHPIA